MKKKVFDEGNLVFAKVRGYPAWPARVMAVISSGKYSVFFYGTYEVGNIKPEQMWPYNKTNLDKFGPPNKHKKWYSEGLYQIENTPEIAFHHCNVGAVDDDHINVDGEYVVEKSSESSSIEAISMNELKEDDDWIDHVQDKQKEHANYLNEGNVDASVEFMEGKKSFLDMKLAPQEWNENVEENKKDFEDMPNDLIGSTPKQKVKKLKWLKLEQEVVNIVCQIQRSMSKNKPYNISKCLEMLKLLEKMDIKPLMVIKMPEVFMTVKRLSTERIPSSDDASAAEVKEISERLQHKIIHNICPGTGSPMCLEEFENILANKVKRFKKKTLALSDRERLGIIDLEHVDSNV